jgi:hypothetical protein
MGILSVYSDSIWLESIFSRVVVEAFKEFLHKFLEAYFDDWTVLKKISKSY